MDRTRFGTSCSTRRTGRGTNCSTARIPKRTNCSSRHKSACTNYSRGRTPAPRRMRTRQQANKRPTKAKAAINLLRDILPFEEVLTLVWPGHSMLLTIMSGSLHASFPPFTFRETAQRTFPLADP